MDGPSDWECHRSQVRRWGTCTHTLLHGGHQQQGGPACSGVGGPGGQPCSPARGLWAPTPPTMGTGRPWGRDTGEAQWSTRHRDTSCTPHPGQSMLGGVRGWARQAGRQAGLGSGGGLRSAHRKAQPHHQGLRVLEGPEAGWPGSSGRGGEVQGRLHFLAETPEKEIYFFNYYPSKWAAGQQALPP